MDASVFLSPAFLFAVGGFFLNLYTIPTILNPDAAIPRLQSVPTVLTFIGFYMIPYIRLEYYISAVSTGIGVVLWTYIAIYRTPQSSAADAPSETTQLAD